MVKGSSMLMALICWMLCSHTPMANGETAIMTSHNETNVCYPLTNHIDEIGFSAISNSIICSGTNNLIRYIYDLEAMRDNNAVSNVIQTLALSGEICKVFGHNWRDGRPGEGDGSLGWYADYHPNVTYRTCRICRKCESMTLEWK